MCLHYRYSMSWLAFAFAVAIDIDIGAGRSATAQLRLVSHALRNNETCSCRKEAVSVVG